MALIVGAAAASALWAAIGLGAGAIVRSQVPTVVGLFVWVLFVENILYASLPKIGSSRPEHSAVPSPPVGRNG